MKRLLFLSVLLMSILVCGVAFAADIAGKYICTHKDIEGTMDIKRSGSLYSANITNYVVSTQPAMGSGFEGKGTLKGNILTVAGENNGHKLQIAIKFSGNVATIADDSVIGDDTHFSGASGGPGFNYTYKKKK